MPIHAFLSYSHKNRKLARRLKEGLAEFGIEAFLADDDIGVSEHWRRVILKKLRDCEMFIPILTDAFVESEWTDQEAGFALARGKRVVPLKVDLGPYGFIGAFQALRLNGKMPTETCWMIMGKSQGSRDSRTESQGKCNRGFLGRAPCLRMRPRT